MLAVHGGAGMRSQLTSNMEEQFRSAIRAALSVGYDTLKQEDEECSKQTSSVATLQCRKGISIW